MFTIYSDRGSDSTMVSNLFIDEYMKSANDAQIKVYLYLLRMMSAHRTTSISDLADQFNHTEKDVVRSLRYWEQKGLLDLTFGSEDNLISICLRKPRDISRADRREGGASFVCAQTGTDAFAQDGRNVRAQTGTDAAGLPAVSASPAAPSLPAAPAKASAREVCDQDLYGHDSREGHVLAFPSAAPSSRQDTCPHPSGTAFSNTAAPADAAFSNSAAPAGPAFSNAAASADPSPSAVPSPSAASSSSHAPSAFAGTSSSGKTAKTAAKAKKEGPGAEMKAIESFSSSKDRAQLLFAIEQYIGKPLSMNEIRTIWHISEGLHFSDELIDYLLQYCVDRGKKDFRYISKVAENWAENGITTPAQAEASSEEKTAKTRAAAAGRTGNVSPQAGTKSPRSKNSFNQFEQNSYDFDALENELLSVAGN